MAATHLAGMLIPLDGMVREWLDEDVSSYDIGGAVVGDTEMTATIYAKTDGLVVAGYPFVEAVLSHLGCKVQWVISEGTPVPVSAEEKRVAVGHVSGPVNRLLQAERTCLEVMVRSSSIATLARQAKQTAEAAGYKGVVAGTRKTTPGRYRLVEKYALMVAGVDTHRYSLSSMVMLKDNHIDACGGSITAAVQKARPLAGFSTKIEVECRSEADAYEACTAGADVIMLDNFTPAEVGPAAERIKAKHPNVIIEISGGIRLHTIADFVKSAPHVDVVSMGILTQGPPIVDLSMKINKR
eukprot:NODE_4778_length_1020_cov_37.721293_g4573_i0.p1 GENE.NODE_4778_length_1020_cov_37.721293_g4573_i0~~NODE_4778_length_1020_cov_37.721293_g4573_i0.p1  ORF type:complete len:316 (-),score=74.49 NODE_4778_length_1020_cov_37.721293_g4573_i0:72-962(-)